MNSLPNFVVADSLRTVTIALWGVMLSLSFWTLWYAAHLRRFYHKLRQRNIAFFSVFWHVLTLVTTILVMGTEISWKVIFNGVGRVGISLWTYPNVPIYLLADIGLYLVWRLERDRYVKTKVRLRLLELREHERRHKSAPAETDIDSKDS